MTRLVVLALAAVAVGGACAPPQSDGCKQYIACQQEYDAASGTGPVDVSQYEADGACWDSADNAATCDQQCTEGIAAVRDAAANANLDVPSCQG